MKILQVTPFLSPVHGGSAEVPYQVSKQLAMRGHEVTIYTSDYLLSPEYVSSLPGVRIYIFKRLLSWIKFHLTPAIIKRIKDDIADFDVIHLHNCYTFQNIVVHYYAKKNHIPYVVQSHGSVASYFQKGIPKKLFDALWGKRILRDASKLIAVASVEAERYRSMGVDRGKIEIIPHGIDFSEFEDLPPRGEFRTRYGCSDKEKLILFLGRIDRIKGLDLLAKVFADLSKELADTRLVIVGPDDGYLPELKRLIKRLQIEPRVLLTGPLYGREKLQAYVDADIYVLPSSIEIFGITVLEALACGTPVVFTDRCGVADWIDTQSGLIIPYARNQLLDALIYMLNDNRIRQQFAERGRELVIRKFSWEKIVEAMQGLYQTT